MGLKLTYRREISHLMIVCNDKRLIINPSRYLMSLSINQDLIQMQSIAKQNIEKTSKKKLEEGVLEQIPKLKILFLRLS